MAYQIVVQVFCTGMGWVDSKYGGNTLEEAIAAEQLLLATDSAWVNPEAKRQTKLRHVEDTKFNTLKEV